MTKHTTHRLLVITFLLATFGFPFYVLISGNDPISQPNSVLGALTKGIGNSSESPALNSETQAQANVWSDSVGQSFIGESTQ